MTTLALIRHGETDWNRRGLIQGVTDVPLNETGLAQAARAAEELVSYPLARDWAGVVTSPLVRAFATGLVIAHSLSIPMLEPMPQQGPTLRPRHELFRWPLLAAIVLLALVIVPRKFAGMRARAA